MREIILEVYVLSSKTTDSLVQDEYLKVILEQ